MARGSERDPSHECCNLRSFFFICAYVFNRPCPELCAGRVFSPLPVQLYRLSSIVHQFSSIRRLVSRALDAVARICPPGSFAGIVGLGSQRPRPYLPEKMNGSDCDVQFVSLLAGGNSVAEVMPCRFANHLGLGTVLGYGLCRAKREH